MPNGSAARLNELCVALNISVSDLARIVSQPQANIETLLQNRYHVGIKLQAQVLEQFTNLHPLWLLSGEGEMFRGQPHNHLAVNYGCNVQIINNNCQCHDQVDLLKNHLHEKERVIQMLMHQALPLASSIKLL
jgi:hypothetical protein